MVFFIFVIILMFSLSGVLYLMVRALPRVAEVEGAGVGAMAVGGAGVDTVAGAGTPGRKKILDRWAHSELPEKIDGAFNVWFLKFLRKFKVFTLKLDNAITKHLHKIHRERETNEKKSAIDFKEISGQNKEAEE